MHVHTSRKCLVTNNADGTFLSYPRYFFQTVLNKNLDPLKIKFSSVMKNNMEQMTLL